MKTADEDEIDGLLARGDEFAAKGDPRAAISFFQAALKRARQGLPVSADTLSRLQKAGVFIQARAREFERALDRAIGDPGSEDPLGGLRLAHALDMVKGRREIYPQQPSMFYYPYLAQQQFFDASEFGWASGVEAETGEIREELLNLLDDDAEFRPYVEDDPDRPSARPFYRLGALPFAARKSRW